MKRAKTNAEFFDGFISIGPPTKKLTVPTDQMLSALGVDPAKWKLASAADSRDERVCYFHLRAIETPQEKAERERRERIAIHGSAE